MGARNIKACRRKQCCGFGVWTKTGGNTLSRCLHCVEKYEGVTRHLTGAQVQGEGPGKGRWSVPVRMAASLAKYERHHMRTASCPVTLQEKATSRGTMRGTKEFSGWSRDRGNSEKMRGKIGKMQKQARVRADMSPFDR